MTTTQLTIAPTGMRLHEWIALERGYFQAHGIEPIVRWDILSGIMSNWQGKSYKEWPQDLPFVGAAEPVDVINHCAWGSVCNAGAGLGQNTLGTGQTAGLITKLKPASQIVDEVVDEAQTIIAERLRGLVIEPAQVMAMTTNC